jgi:hypothetical protein
MPGPYVQLATFCEKVLQEADGVLSVIRAVDRIVLTAQGEGAPDELPQLPLNLSFVLALKPDEARGRHTLTLTVQQPSGLSLPPRDFDVMFEGDERGVNVVMQMQLEAIEGLYWLDVTLGGTLLTRVPLRVMYQRIPSGP